MTHDNRGDRLGIFPLRQRPRLASAMKQPGRRGASCGRHLACGRPGAGKVHMSLVRRSAASVSLGAGAARSSRPLERAAPERRLPLKGRWAGGGAGPGSHPTPHLHRRATSSATPGARLATARSMAGLAFARMDAMSGSMKIMPFFFSSLAKKAFFWSSTLSP